MARMMTEAFRKGINDKPLLRYSRDFSHLSISESGNSVNEGVLSGLGQGHRSVEQIGGAPKSLTTASEVRL